MAKARSVPRVFNTDKRIRMGIWGLGRGMSFFNTCRFLNIDVVAGCDYNAHMRDNFLKNCPGAFVTADAEDFLRQDFDAVLLATFCPAHADHAIACLRAGKHVLSEVTSFFTLAEGVRLVEEVEKHKLVYNLAENYPFSAANMWLANRWREGLFGELMYGEYEYVHECRMLAYTYIDGLPVQPGHTVHNWRSWLNFHYYCTHSLGPAMVITGTRPVAVETFPAKPRIAGYLTEETGIMTPSLIQMSNGGVIRNLMGASTNDTHQQRIWGTRGSFEIGRDGVRLRLGGTGHSPLMMIVPQWEGLGELAAQTGHGGGDFWTLYYFAREILTGEKGPFDIYGGCDVTIPGIQALRSAREGGKPMEVPDFRDPAVRERYRNDDWHQEAYDAKRGVFGGAALNENAAQFTRVMKDMTIYAPVVRAYLDWKKVQSVLARPAEFAPVARQLLGHYGNVVETFRAARAIVADYPHSDGAKVLKEMLELGEDDRVLNSAFLAALKREVAALNRKFGSDSAGTGLTPFSATSLQPAKGPITAVTYPRTFPGARILPLEATEKFHDIRDVYPGHKKPQGVIFAKAIHTAAKAGKGHLCVAADGPFKVFVNRREIGCNPKATNPIQANPMYLKPTWRKGKNEVLIALDVNGGAAWGFSAKAE